MPVTFAVALRACCVAVALGLATVRAAEPPASPLIGATREQVLTRNGEPKSQMESGNRVIMFYPRERIVVQDNVVIEVEQLAPEPPRKTGNPPTENPPSVSPTAPQNPTAAAPGGSGDNVTSKTPPANSAPPSPTPSTPGTPPPTPAPEPKFEIKLVVPPSAKGSRPSPLPPTTGITPSSSTPGSATPKGSGEQKNPVLPPVTTAPTESPVAVSPSDSTVNVETSAKKTLEDKKAKERRDREAAAEQAKKEKALRDARRRLDEAAATDLTDEAISGRTFLLAAIVVAGGLIFLVWRYRQRQLELAATSVSNTPLAAPAPVAAAETGNVFTAGLLDKLEWKRFEELVASYYNKTGVMAVRTKTGPESPVHIKISWKGESRPFAYVQCIVHPAGLIEAKPVQDFQAALLADNIRRGYVVTTGKFSVSARDIAEEKHITLLPGDIFLEKLNALPASARSELMQTVRGSSAAA